MPSCRFETLGCKVNQYDTQLVREAMLKAGFTEVGKEASADVCIVNTCTVTHQADAEGRRLIRRLARGNPASEIIVMGCYAARDPEALRSLPQVVGVVDQPGEVGELLKKYGVTDVPRRISKFEGHHRTFVKVQDGCMLNCTFCIIPKVRPQLQSRSSESIVAEVAKLVDVGYEEIVLTGIHLGHYGIEFSKNRPPSQWCRLHHLVDKLMAIPGQWRLRLSSLESPEANGQLIQLMSDYPRICPHLHLCLQSGSDAVLARMKRRYRAQSFLRRVDQIRSVLDRPAITTDIIVGFPGETDREFEETLDVCREAGFSKIHIFPFSARTGTPAAEMPTQINPQVVRARREELDSLEKQLAQEYAQSLNDMRLEVMVERFDPKTKLAQGTSCRYLPTSFKGSSEQLGHLVAVRGQRWDNGILRASRTGFNNLSLPVVDPVSLN